MSAEASGKHRREGRLVPGARPAGGSHAALTPLLLQVGRGCSACPSAAQMALRGVSGRLLSRGPGLSLLRGWGSAATQTGQCRVGGRVGRVELEVREHSRGDFPVLCLQKRAGRHRTERPSVRTPPCAGRLRPLSSCLSAPGGFCPRIDDCRGGEAGRGQGQRQ